MTAQQLKNSILQMAVQGKLVPQDPNDEPASVLLERIRAEKQELIKEGKIKKEKNSSEIFRGASRNLPYAFCEQIGKEIRDISDKIPFDIPDSWEWVRLGYIIQIESGKGLSSKQMVEGKVPVYGGNGITGYHNESIIHKETIVIGRVGYYCGSIYITENEAWVTDNAFITTYPEKNIYREYLVYTLRHMNLGRNNNATAQPVVSGKKIYPMLFPLPPLSEQHRIVSKIEELLPYIEKYGKAESKLNVLNSTFPEALKKSILQEAVQGKLVPQNPDDEPASVLLERIRAEKQALFKAGKIKKDKHESVIVTRDKIPYEIIDGKERCIADEVPFELPDSWAWVTLGQIVLNVADGPHFSPQYQDEGVPFISTRNIATGKLNFSSAKFISLELHNELCKRCKPQKGDILYSKGGTTGIAAVNDSDTEFNVWVHVAVLSMSSNIYPYYLAMALNSPHCYEQSQKYTHGTSNRDLGLTRMVKITIPLPPIAEQKRIVAKIEELMQYCDKL